MPSFRFYFFSFLQAGSLILADDMPIEPVALEPVTTQALLPTVLEISTPLSLSQIVELALSHHPLTKKAMWQVESSQAQLGSAKSAYYPELRLKAHAERGKTFQYTNGPDVSYSSAGADLFLSMLLYDFGQREAEVAASTFALQSAHFQQDWTTQKVIIEVLESAYQSLHLEELVECAKISFEDAQKMLSVAKGLNHAGLVSIGDVYMAESTLAQMQIQLFEQESKRDIEFAKLAIKAGLDPKSSLKLVPIEKLLPPQKEHIDKLITLGLENRKDLLAQKARAASTQAENKKAKMAHYPKFNLNAIGGASRALHERTKNDQYEASISLDLPLFDGFKTTYLQQNAYAQAKMADEDTVALQEQISLSILSQVREIQALEQMMPQSEKRLFSCNQAHNSVQERYSAGRISIGELSTSLHLLAAARTRHSEMKIRWMTALSTLAYITGTLSSQTPFTDNPQL